VTNHQLLRKIKTELQEMDVCLAEYDGALSVSFSNRYGSWADRATPPLPMASPLPKIDPDSDALIIMSSGSTGTPKGVRLSHRAVLRNLTMHLTSLDLELADDIRGLQVLPMNFSYGLIASFLSILYLGGTAVLLPYLEPKLLFETITRHDINLFMGTPTIFQYLIEHFEPDAGVSPLRFITLGGDRCKLYALNLIRNRFPAARIYITYGQSEAGPRISTLPHDLIEEIPNSVGLPLKGVEIDILSDNGKRCAPHEAGEIVVRTPSLMNGYFGDSERTSRVIRDGFCYTGDLGYLDERGHLYYVGRKDRNFKFGGRYVNPSFIEQCIASHPLMEDVSVEKKESEQSEVICARIRVRGAPEHQLLQDLKRLCRQHMPAYMVPGEFHFEEHNHYTYKGKKFVPTRKQIT
jgi:long-chain acyl-CoA synthetase